MFDSDFERARRGEGAAIARLLLPYLPALNAFVRTRLSGRVAQRESVEDLVQSVCRDVLTDFPSVTAQDEAGFRSWLFAVVRNKLHKKESFHRAGVRDVGQEQALTLDTSLDEAALLEAYGSSVTPSHDVAAAEEIERIERAFDELPAHYRDALSHVAIAGLSYREAGLLLGKSEDSIRQTVHRARARLATLLDQA